MENENICKLPAGTLIKINLSPTISNIAATEIGTFDKILIRDSQIGLIVETDVWPDETWKDRHYHQLSAPFYKVLLDKKIVIIAAKFVSSKINGFTIDVIKHASET